MSAGLIGQDQLEECVAIARAEGKPLGHVLVEKGIVHAHSVAMALADQHGGPLKTEFGFATGSGAGRTATGNPDQSPGSLASLLRLAPVGEPPVVPLPPPPVAPMPVAKAPTLPVVPLLSPIQPAPVPPTAAAPESTTAAPLTATSVVQNSEIEAAIAARTAAERRANDLLAQVHELEAAGARAAEEASAPLRAQIDELRVRLEADTATEEMLNTNRELVANARATEESLRAELAAERATSADAMTASEALRVELDQLRALTKEEAAAVATAERQLDAVRDELATTVAETEALRTEVQTLRASDETRSLALTAAEHQLEIRDQLSQAVTDAESMAKHVDELQVRHAADSAAASAVLVAEQAADASRHELATALADGETLRSVSASERAARAQAEALTTALRTQLDDLKAQLAVESLARASAEKQHETMRRELDNALIQVKISSREVDAEHATSVEVAAMANELGARVAGLEAELRRARLSVVPPVSSSEVDELRAVIELQEQALAAASARERASADSRNPGVADSESARSYSHEAHFLFALSSEGYELFERSGPAPSIGSIVELSGRRTCRVLRVGPSPFPGGLEACAYLEFA